MRLAAMKPSSGVYSTGTNARSAFEVALLFGAALALTGCAAQRPMMPTPHVYAEGIEEPYAETLPGDLRTAKVEILYATDRSPSPRSDGRLDYGIERSYALAVGGASVNIGGDATWAQLVQDARSGIRTDTLYLDIPTVTELARTPAFPTPYTIVDGLPVVDAGAQREVDEVAAVVERKLRERLDRSPRKEILLYVHGVANTFDDALYTTAELWHYMGREFVPVAYTWPAGKGGALRGYTYDRESSEFTVFHFKRFLDWLGRLPDVTGIHIVSHSRGTDVVMTGIRELVTEARARGERPRERYKLRNVVMAAPDINVEIAMMRSASEFFGVGMDRLTFYTSPRDQAIGIAEFLFSGGLRLGQLNFASAGTTIKDLASRTGGDQTVVEYTGTRGGAYGHDYFRMNPAVSSDLVLTVRYGRKPGAENGRPLHHEAGAFWTIGDDYLLDTPGQ